MQRKRQGSPVSFSSYQTNGDFDTRSTGSFSSIGSHEIRPIEPFETMDEAAEDLAPRDKALNSILDSFFQ